LPLICISGHINEVKTKKYTRWELKKWLLVALTGWSHEWDVFIRKYMDILPGQKIVVVITMWLHYQGGRKVGFHCNEEGKFVENVSVLMIKCKEGL